MRADRTLDLVDLGGQPLVALLSLPDEPLGDRTGNREDADRLGLAAETTVQLYDPRSQAQPIGKLLQTFSPQTLRRLSADLGLRDHVVPLAEVRRLVRWVHDEERKAKSYETYKPRPFAASRPSALAERLVAA